MESESLRDVVNELIGKRSFTYRQAVLNVNRLRTATTRDMTYELMVEANTIGDRLYATLKNHHKRKSAADKRAYSFPAKYDVIRFNSGEIEL